MFFLVTKSEPLILKPRFVNKHIDANLFKQLRAKVEGKHSAKHGYVISIVAVDQYSQGVIDTNDASVHFLVTYKALVFQLFRDEVVRCEVTKVSRDGVYCACGPATIFVHCRNLHGAVFEDAMQGRPRFAFPYNRQPPVEEKGHIHVRILNSAVAADVPTWIGELAQERAPTAGDAEAVVKLEPAY